MSCNKFWVTRRETSTHSFEVFPYLSNAIVFYKLHSRSFQSFLHLVSRFKRYIGCLDGPLPTEHYGVTGIGRGHESIYEVQKFHLIITIKQILNESTTVGNRRMPGKKFKPTIIGGIFNEWAEKSKTVQNKQKCTSCTWKWNVSTRDLCKVDNFHACHTTQMEAKNPKCFHEDRSSLWISRGKTPSF